jgi:hypothetical protein
LVFNACGHFITQLVGIVRTIQPLSELNINSKELTFIQAGIASGNSGNGRRATINLGIGPVLASQ